MARDGELAWLAGRAYGSPWLAIDQALVDQFADVTGDHQFIHVDPVRAADTAFGGAIAHGFLLLSLLPQLHAASNRPALPALAMAVNYGFDRIRFIAPVRVGSRVRAHFEVATIVEKRSGEW
jgi:acyl dehydratase